MTFFMNLDLKAPAKKNPSTPIPKSATAVQVLDTLNGDREIQYRRLDGKSDQWVAALHRYKAPRHVVQLLTNEGAIVGDNQGSNGTVRIFNERRTSTPKKNPASAFDVIRVGDRVTIVNRFGQEHTGRAVMKGPGGWVLNMGGAHGTPGIATPQNIVKVVKPKEKALHRSAKETAAQSIISDFWKSKKNPAVPFDTIRLGSIVTIDQGGSPITGVAVARKGKGWALYMGGQHKWVATALSNNTLSVKPGKPKIKLSSGLKQKVRGTRGWDRGMPYGPLAFAEIHAREARGRADYGRRAS